MTCQDCIHHNVCYYAGRLKTKDSDGEKRIIAETNNVEDTCENFQDRSLLVKPPCKVGDILYEPTDRGTISEYRVTAIRVELFSTFVEWKIKEGIVWRYVHEINSNEIGKTVFFSREEAKQTLKEREKNEM